MDPAEIRTAPQELRTARLTLRSYRLEDVPIVTRLAGAREVAAATTNIPHPYTEADAHSFFRHATEECRVGRSAVFAVTITSNHELVGAVGLTISPAHLRAELGYWIGTPYWGKGFATEAALAVVGFGFETLLHRIHASHFVGNIASQRVLEKIGMRHEGAARGHVHKWDRFVDLENYGLLASEFRKVK